MALEDVIKGAKEGMASTLEAAKKLKLGVLDLIPAFYTLAKGEGVAKAIFSAIKWTALSAAIPIVSGVGIAFFSLTKTISAIVRATGSLDAAIRRIGETTGLEKVFTPLLQSAGAAKDRVAELVQFSESTPFELRGVAEASKSLELLGPSSLAFGAGLKSVGDVAAATGNRIEDIAGEIGMLNSQLKAGADIGGTIESLRNMGVVSQLTARDIMRLSDSGAGMSLIWSKVQDSMSRSSGGIAKANEEIGNLQGRLDKTKEGLKAAFGQPFIDAEKTGIKNSIKTMENLKPALSAVASALSEVTNATSNIKSGFLAWATSIPHLSDILGGLTRVVTNIGVAFAAAGGVALANRVRNIGGIISNFRERTKIKETADDLINAAERHSRAAVRLKAGAIEAAEIGDTAKAAKLTRMAGAATVRGRLATAGAAGLGEGTAIRGIAATGVAAAGRALMSPWLILPVVIASAVSAVQSLISAQKVNKQAVDAVNKSNRETVLGLQEQISKVSTLDDKYRAIAAATNAVAAARTKLAEIKLPSDDHHLTVLQRTLNELQKVPGLRKATEAAVQVASNFGLGPTIEGAFTVLDKLGLKPGKQESKAAVQEKALKIGIAQMQRQQDIARAVPEEQLVTERNIALSQRRGIFQRRAEDVQREVALSTAPTAAARQAVLTGQSETFTGRARRGAMEESLFQQTERRNDLLQNDLVEPLRKFTQVAGDLQRMGQEGNKGAEARNQEIDRRTEEILKTKPGVTVETARAEATKEQLKPTAVRAVQAKAIAERATDLAESSQGAISKKEALKQATKEIGAMDKDEAEARGKIIKSEETITQIREKQAAERRSSFSELQQISQAIEDISAKKPAAVFGRPVDTKDVPTLAARKGILEEDKNIENIEKNIEEGRARATAAAAEKRQARLEKPDIAAEQEILSIRTEGLDREEKLTEITERRNAEELIQIRKNRSELTAPGPEEEDPNIRRVKVSEEENRRRKIEITNQKKELEFSRRSLEIESTTGRGPSEEIHSLDRQIELTKEQMQFTAQSKTLGEDERKERIASLAKQQVMMEKAKSDIQFNRDQELDAAKSVTEQISLQSRGLDFLANLEATRIGYVQRIAQAYRDGNDALGQQLITQGQINIAQQLGHKELGDLVRDEKTGNLRELNGSEQAQRSRDEQAVKDHAKREQAAGQSRINQAREVIARGGTTTDTEALAAMKAQDDTKREAEKQKAQKQAEEANQQAIVQKAQILTSAKEKKAEGKKLTKEEERALKAEAAPFKEALGESEKLLEQIRDTIRTGQGSSPVAPGGQGGEGGAGARGGQGGAAAPAAPASEAQEPMPTPTGGAEGPGPSSGVEGPEGQGQYPTNQEAWYNREKQAREQHAAAPETIKPQEGLTSNEMSAATPGGYSMVSTGGDSYVYQKNPYEPSAPPAEQEKGNVNTNIPGGSMEDAIQKMSPGPGWSYNSSDGRWISPEEGRASDEINKTDNQESQAGVRKAPQPTPDVPGLQGMQGRGWKWNEQYGHWEKPMAAQSGEPGQSSQEGEPGQPGQAGGQPPSQSDQSAPVAESGPEWLKEEDRLLISRPEDKQSGDSSGVATAGPAQPGQPAQPLPQNPAPGGDLTKILTEIKASIDNLTKKVGVA